MLRILGRLGRLGYIVKAGDELRRLLEGYVWRDRG